MEKIRCDEERHCCAASMIKMANAVPSSKWSIDIPCSMSDEELISSYLYHDSIPSSFNHAIMSDGIPSSRTPCKCPHSLLSSALEPLLHASSHRPQVAVHLARVLAQDQADNALPRDCDVLEATQDVNLLVCQYDACPARVLDGKAGLSVLASDTADCAT